MLKLKASQKVAIVGFTLIELLVTFSLISIISGVGFASFVTYSRRQAVIQQAYDLKQAIDLARFNALASVKPQACDDYDLTSYYVNFCANNIAGCITQDVDVDYEVVAHCDTVSSVVAAEILPESVTLSNQEIVAEDQCVTPTFNASTVAESVPCAIYLEGYGNEIRVDIDEKGYITFTE